MKVKSESEVAQSCPTASDPMDCSLPGSAIHGIFQARVPEWGAIAFSGTVCLKIVKKENSVVCYLSQFLKIFFFSFKVFGHATEHVGSLVPQPGTEPSPPTVEVQNLDHWTPGNSHHHFLSNNLTDYFGVVSSWVDGTILFASF